VTPTDFPVLFESSNYKLVAIFPQPAETRAAESLVRSAQTYQDPLQGAQAREDQKPCARLEQGDARVAKGEEIAKQPCESGASAQYESK
jgi:hypothetical protein